MTENRVLLLIVTGPSGGGKDCVMKKLVTEHGFRRVLTCCAGRPIRDNEQQGVDYDFLSVDKFKEMIDNEEFLEYAQYGKTLKGTRKLALEKVLEEKTVWRIDAGTAAIVKSELFPRKNLNELIPITKTIYLGVDNLMALYKRQINRDVNTNKDDVLERLKIDWDVWNKNRNKYDVLVINRNNELDETVRKVLTACNH